MSNWVKTLASFFYVGYLPWAPGSFGSLAGLLIGWYFYGALPYLTVAFCLLGFVICKPATAVFLSPDPSAFVLDEVSGMMLSVLWLPKTPFVFLAGFILFRLLDILKPWPISRIQKSPNPSSIMWDDLAAGALANAILQLLVLTRALPV